MIGKVGLVAQEWTKPLPVHDRPPLVFNRELVTFIRRWERVTKRLEETRGTCMNMAWFEAMGTCMDLCEEFTAKWGRPYEDIDAVYQQWKAATGI